MTLLDLFWHVSAFVLPACFLALLMPLVARWRTKPAGRAPRYAVQCGLQLVCGVLVLIAGLVITGQDGRMATYAALVTVAGSLQALMSRPARKA